mmetsp:Transcript_3414/g.6034  ORF Transcript_3414/g.6034 Transcript_3414/m.6034 type:complete len:216 (-) Transcript_3414:266-913(-)
MAVEATTSRCWEGRRRAARHRPCASPGALQLRMCLGRDSQQVDTHRRPPEVWSACHRTHSLSTSDRALCHAPHLRRRCLPPPRSPQIWRRKRRCSRQTRSPRPRPRHQLHPSPCGRRPAHRRAAAACARSDDMCSAAKARRAAVGTHPRGRRVETGRGDYGGGTPTSAGRPAPAPPAPMHPPSLQLWLGARPSSSALLRGPWRRGGAADDGGQER